MHGLNGETAPRARRGKVVHDNAGVRTELLVLFVCEWGGGGGNGGWEEPKERELCLQFGEPGPGFPRSQSLGE